MFGGLDYISSKAANCSSGILEEALESTAKMHRNLNLAEKKNAFSTKLSSNHFYPKLFWKGSGNAGRRKKRPGRTAILLLVVYHAHRHHHPILVV